MSAAFLGKLVPVVRRRLDEWKTRAHAIPDPELRRQALASIQTKTFHCEGGAVYAFLAGPRWEDAIRFIVAYQTISDYLDNLCDRSTSVDPDDFRCLHRSMADALTPGTRSGDYYAYRAERLDGGYLADLVATCQEVLGRLPALPQVAPTLLALERYYAELQEHKHVRVEERVTRLEQWHKACRDHLPDIAWYEFSAAAGSTLGIFCLVSSAFDGRLAPDYVERVRDAYFPWFQGFHILMDYLVDEEEDCLGGDLNFCSFYDSDRSVVRGITRFFREARTRTSALPPHRFHRLVASGLLALYVSDKKVATQKRVRRIAFDVLLRAGWSAWCFLPICWVFRRLRARGVSGEP